MTSTHPKQRGEAYVAVVRDFTEAMYDRVLHDHYIEELDYLTGHFARMSVGDLDLVLEGIHDALLEHFDDLISARSRAPGSIPSSRAVGRKRSRA